MTKYHRTSEAVDVLAWTGSNLEAIVALCPDAEIRSRHGKTDNTDDYLVIQTPEGSMGVSLNSYVAKYDDGSFGVLDRYLFEAVPAVKASLVTGRIVWTAKTAGVAGNDITVKLLGGANGTLACTVAGTDITVQLETSAASAVLSTVAEVIAKVADTVAAAALVTCASYYADDTLLSFVDAETHLTGGLDADSSGIVYSVGAGDAADIAALVAWSEPISTSVTTLEAHMAKVVFANDAPDDPALGTLWIDLNATPVSMSICTVIKVGETPATWKLITQAA